MSYHNKTTNNLEELIKQKKVLEENLRKSMACIEMDDSALVQVYSYGVELEEIKEKIRVLMK